MAIVAIVFGTATTTAAGGVSASRRSQHAGPASASRPSRPNKADWEKIKTAAGLRTMALAAHRTARYRAFAAELGLRELVSIRPIAPGRCATAVRDLYNNLLDLENAYPGEDWTPLRRAVAKEPPIAVCAPRASRHHHA